MSTLQWQLTAEEQAEIDNDPYGEDVPFDEIIRKEIIPNLKPGALVYLNGGPGSQEEARKRAERNRKAREKRAQNREEKESQKTVTAGPKRKAMSPSAHNQGDDDEGPAAKQPRQDRVAVYIIVEAPATPGSRPKTKATGVSARPPAHRGPFWLDIEANYETFKGLLAKTLPCRPENLPLAHLQWKYDKPVNDRKKSVATPMGYEALQESLKERTKDRAITIHMPPPTQDATTWDTGDGNYVDMPFDFYDEFASTVPSELSAKAQIAAIETKSVDHLHDLKAQYPVNNHAALFPGKRVFHQKGSYWDLTDLKLKIWANSLSLGSAGVSLNQPPISMHFDMDHRLKPAHSRQDENTAPSHHLTPRSPSCQTSVPYPYPYAPPPYAYPPMFGYPPFPQFYPKPPASPPPPLAANPPPVLESPKTALRLKIPLAAFCQRYDIPDSDQEKLVKLEYRPGNRVVEKMPASEWKDGCGFSFMGWETFLDAHRVFLKDAKDGKWAPE
ncbi:hypothetical protein BDZ97DRAFT_1765296 [Flammula alnicola]|nr:hypothetical protein BDZ97DRAFT_1765296 [Flammula alnicola]